ncbi:kinase phosphorylation protein-domain-containing protein [Gymnopilus junonius]|uniref:Kinase phosphorylation protein-domain-containing protein n=1 Tax=Gymnopilus junonius TaxID=109634 RepID=A0A9P5NPV9_GYMJU|nr:kinase phosphorylation protein-domain-containing protein [Gymnopilus junonius]
MFEPVRGGTRGGQAEFKWSDVSADKDRENYLGHSINAPTGRWQKNKDIHWYNRDIDTSAAERAEEIKKIKDLEADALAVALGFEPASKTGGKTTGANSIPVASSSNGESQAKADKEEKRRRKEERRAEKRARKELKKLSQLVRMVYMNWLKSQNDLDDIPLAHDPQDFGQRNAGLTGEDFAVAVAVERLDRTHGMQLK